MNLQDLVTKYGSRELIPYGEFLLTEEWKQKRTLILDCNDRYCERCGISPERKLWHSDGNLFPYKQKDIIPIKGNIITVFGLPYCSTFENNWLEVHHKYYLLDANYQWKFPWDYETQDLQCLCNWCHVAVHHQNKGHLVFIEAIDGSIKLVDNLTPCQKCDGKGWIPEYSYHLAGICFDCNGDRFVELMKRSRC